MSKKASPKPSQVLLTDRAVSDLLSIEAYSISKWGKDATTKYLAKFEKAFKLLELNPDVLLANETLSISLLFYRVEKHLLACIRIKSSIVVLTILHANRDLVPILHELLPTINLEVAVLLIKAGET